MKRNMYTQKLRMLSKRAVFLAIMVSAVQANDQGNNANLVVLSCNCYAFDQQTSALLKTVSGGKNDLMSRTALSSWERIDQIAIFIKMQVKKPDVILFQELWLDEHKLHMIAALGKEYPHRYYVSRTGRDQSLSFAESINQWFSNKNASTMFSSEELKTLNPFKVGSGLLIVARKEFPFQKTIAITYADKIGDERQAYKGALCVQVEDRKKQRTIIATTHLQSGGGKEVLEVQRKQLTALGALLNKIAEKNDKVIITGDLNEATVYYKENNIFFDESYSGIQALNMASNNARTFYNPLVPFVAKALRVPEKNIIFHDAFHQDTVESTEKTKRPDGQPAYFGHSTDYDGYQILDHCFCTTNVRLINAQSFRKEILGDNGAQQPYAKGTALSDHAAIILLFGDAE